MDIHRLTTSDAHLHTATLLPDGKVLAAGGTASTTTELYDPVTGNWTATGTLNAARIYHTATLLPNGKTIVAGGDIIGNSAEIFDAIAGKWTLTGLMNTARAHHTATLLPIGKVLVAGGTAKSVTGFFFQR